MGKPRDSHLIRDADAAQNLEIMLVSSVVTIVVTRLYLQLTGFPQIGGGTLHIAHMLWGGLLMLVGLISLISYLNFSVRVGSSLTAGIGFGLFIDELGKFITADNDYFFQPTFAVMYVLFIALFLLLRSVFVLIPLTETEKAVNAQLRTNPDLAGANDSRLVVWYLKATARVKSFYQAMVQKRRFRDVLVTVFVVLSVWHLGTAIVTIAGRHETKLGVFDLIYLGSTIVSGLFVLVGIVQLGRSRLNALRLFRLAMLVSIFVTQVFLFYLDELSALWGLVVDLITYLSLTTMIRIEKESAE